MTYILCPEKLFVFFCLHPPLRPLTSGPAAESERERDTYVKRTREEEEEEDLLEDKRVGEQSERCSGQRQSARNDFVWICTLKHQKANRELVTVSYNIHYLAHFIPPANSV